VAVTSCIQVSVSLVCDAIRENEHLTNREAPEEMAHVPQSILTCSDFCQVFLLRHDIAPALCSSSVATVFLPRDSTPGIVTGYWLVSRGIGVWLVMGSRDISFHYVIHTVSGGPLSLLSYGYGGLFPLGKAAHLHLVPTSRWRSNTSTPIYVFMALCLSTGTTLLLLTLLEWMNA
jgi:hypothetical protein